MVEGADRVRVVFVVLEGLTELAGMDFVVVRRVGIIVLDLRVLDEILTELADERLVVEVAELVFIVERTGVMVFVLTLLEDNLTGLLDTVLADATRVEMAVLVLVDETAPQICFDTKPVKMFLTVE